MATQRGTRGWLGYGFVAPALLLLIALNIFPLLYNVRLSFTDARLTGGPAEHVGGANYGRVFDTERYPTYIDALRTTARFVGVTVGIELLLGFVLALCLRDRFPGKPVVLLCLLVPMMLSPAVMGLYWTLIFDQEYGVLNHVLGALGVASPPRWLTDPDAKFWAVAVVDIWMWTPFMMLIAMAGLNAIPRHLYEAAEIDRAGRWQVFRRITLPLCAPLLILAALLRTTDAIKQFDYVMAITGPTEASTRTLSVWLFQLVFENHRVGLGSAYGCVVLVVVIALASVFIRYIDGLREAQGRAS